MVEPEVVGKPHGYPFHVVSLVHDIVAEEALIKLHFAFEEGGTMTNMECQDFLPGLGFACILALQENTVGVYKTLKMRDGTVFFLYHLVGLFNENPLIFLVHLGGPKQLEFFQDFLGFLLAVFGHRRIELLHFLHGFGRVFGKSCKALSLSHYRQAKQHTDTKNLLHHYIEKWCAKITKRCQSLHTMFQNLLRISEFLKPCCHPFVFRLMVEILHAVLGAALAQGR